MKRLVCILMCLSLLMSMFLTAAAEDAATVKEIPDDILAMIGPYGKARSLDWTILPICYHCRRLSR